MCLGYSLRNVLVWWGWIIVRSWYSYCLSNRLFRVLASLRTLIILTPITFWYPIGLDTSHAKKTGQVCFLSIWCNILVMSCDKYFANYKKVAFIEASSRLVYRHFKKKPLSCDDHEKKLILTVSLFPFILFFINTLFLYTPQLESSRHK